jgi:hypothetical protein
VTFIQRIDNRDIRRVLYDKVKKTTGSGYAVRQRSITVSEADVRVEPKSSEPLQNAQKRLEQLLTESFSKDKLK